MREKVFWFYDTESCLLQWLLLIQKQFWKSFSNLKWWSLYYILNVSIGIAKLTTKMIGLLSYFRKLWLAVAILRSAYFRLDEKLNFWDSVLFYKSCRPKACNFIKKETLARVLSCEFCKICKNNRRPTEDRTPLSCLNMSATTVLKVFDEAFWKKLGWNWATYYPNLLSVKGKRANKC